jgi:hypothetical protein
MDVLLANVNLNLFALLFFVPLNVLMAFCMKTDVLLVVVNLVLL